MALKKLHNQITFLSFQRACKSPSSIVSLKLLYSTEAITRAPSSYDVMWQVEGDSDRNERGERSGLARLNSSDNLRESSYDLVLGTLL